MKKKSSGIVRSTFIIVLITLIVKITGLIKQTIMAWKFGSNLYTDAYYIAEGFIGPINIVFFSAVSVMFLSVYLNQTTEKEKDSLVYGMICIYLMIAIVTIVVINVFAMPLARVIAPGYSIEELKIVAKVLRVLSFIFVFYCIASVTGGVLEGNKIFGPSKLQGFFVNISVIIGCLCFSDKYGIMAILLCTLVGYFMYMISNLWFVHSYSFINKFSIVFFDKRIGYILKISIPLMIGNAITDFHAIIDKMIASSLSEGSVSNLYYAQVLSVDLVSALFVTSIGSVFFPYFVEYVAEREIDCLKDVIKKSLSVFLTCMFLITILYFFSADKIVEFFLVRGKFSMENAEEVKLIIIFYSIGFIAMPIRDMMIKVHYAFHDTKSPMLNGIFGVALNCIISFFLAKNIGIVGIAIGTSISYYLIAFMSMLTVKKHIGKIGLKSVAVECWKIFLSSIVCVFVLLGLKKLEVLENIFLWMISCGVIVLIYFTSLFLMNSDSVSMIFGFIMKKEGRKNNE